METSQEHPWLVAVSHPLDTEKVSQAVSDSHPDWEYVDAEIIKLGTISHRQVDIKEVQQRALKLLEIETKDMRLLAHLLRTLQHNGDSNDALLALVLFHRYVSLFWQTAYPNVNLKVRIATQIMKRFTQNADSLGLNATAADREIALTCLTQVSEFWALKYEGLETEITSLKQKIENAETQPDAKTSASAATGDQPSESMSKTQNSSTSPTPNTPTLPVPSAQINIDNSNERAWKNTLIKVAEHLFDQFPDREISYRLRRTAIWLTIDGILQADEQGVTQLGIPVSKDRLSEYLSSIQNANVALLKQVENSLTLSPYWFEGHHIASRMAKQLGYTAVAEAIRTEVEHVLARIPALMSFRFNDQTPFVSESVLQWLNSTANTSSSSALLHSSNQETDAMIWQCYQDNGLAAALQTLDALPQKETRAHYYQQVLATQLMEEAGLVNLAQQQREQIRRTAENLTVSEWEPSFLTAISAKKND